MSKLKTQEQIEKYIPDFYNATSHDKKYESIVSMLYDAFDAHFVQLVENPTVGWLDRPVLFISDNVELPFELEKALERETYTTVKYTSTPIK